MMQSIIPLLSSPSSPSFGFESLFIWMVLAVLLIAGLGIVRAAILASRRRRIEDEWRVARRRLVLSTALRRAHRPMAA